MPTGKTGFRLRWKGFEDVDTVEKHLVSGRGVSIRLADNYHHALSVRLCPRAGLHGHLQLRGGTEILTKIAALPGLHDFADLVEPARAVDAAVHVTSPPAQVKLVPQPHSSRSATP
jgi:hypothetical protein